MNKIKTFYGSSLYSLENDINEFARDHKIINTNICTEKHGYNVSYTIVVLYENN